MTGGMSPGPIGIGPSGPPIGNWSRQCSTLKKNIDGPPIGIIYLFIEGL